MLIGVVGDELRVRVSSPPVEGRANDDVVGLLVTSLGLRPRQVTLVGGFQSRSKSVWVDLGVDETADAIDRALGGSERRKR